MAPNRGGGGGGVGGRKPRFVHCEGAPSWTPDAYMDDAALQRRAEEHLARDDLASAIAASFGVRRGDGYVYHAIASVTLPQAQHFVAQGPAPVWYRDPAPDAAAAGSAAAAAGTTAAVSEGAASQPRTLPPPLPPALPPPPRADIDAYLAVFSPATATPAALRGLAGNARKGSVRAQVASHLLAKRFVHEAPAYEALRRPPRVRGGGAGANANAAAAAAHANPYLAFVAWASRALGWAGPCGAAEAAASRGPSSHPALAVLYHHFGCACPSHEALEALRRLAAGREVLDVGSGGGYWTYLLRRRGVRCTPVDSGQSAWRVAWVADTVEADGADYVRRHGGGGGGSGSGGARDAVLLLVYPIVGGGVAGGRPGDFTRGLLAAYEGDTLAVVGTQNHNGYTGFRGETMDEFMARDEQRAQGWVRVLQIPLPSFPGKDEALFVFQRGERAPPGNEGQEGGAEEAKSGGGRV
ncbi:hypothetical protein GGR56DRAFT_666088 [Xylariaceae sp. FL0804]|nr:hypothetical protein GGR56DRAFT_666088 [Xylariaceae sp. FL0804]